MALLLDLANIVGGFLLAAVLLRLVPRVGDDLGRLADRAAPYAWIVGLVALAAGGYYLIVHLVSGPRVFHFEVVGVGVGLALLWRRLTGRAEPHAGRSERRAGLPEHVGLPGARAERPGGPTGVGLLLAVFGLIAIVVGIQGLFTPDG
ncbi:hypothetical protein ACFFWC_20280 [Plantactinospora siamensis]|uniref:Uncharacterized protein n=1 Tax=Plantactinospora siamensis TaxID=555372 RepID=A0ABV6P318_9ACTN